MDFVELEKRLSRGETLLDLNRPAEALPLLLEVLADAPDKFRAVCLVARCYIDLDDHKNALEYSSMAVALFPASEWGHRLRSISLVSLGKKKEALAAAEEAVRCEPEEPAALHTLANALRNAGKLEKAREVSQSLLKISPDSHDAHLTAGVIDLDLGYARSAEQHFKECLKIDPMSVLARNNLGVSAATGYQDRDQAVVHFQEAVKMSPADRLALDNLYIQYSNLPVLIAILFFLPITAIGIFIVPGYVVLFFVMMIFVYGKIAVSNFLARRKLPVEFKARFRSESFKTRRDRWLKTAWILAKKTAKNFAELYAISIGALVLKLLSVYFDSAFLGALAIIAIFGGAMIFGYRNDSAQRKQEDFSIFKN